MRVRLRKSASRSAHLELNKTTVLYAAMRALRCRLPTPDQSTRARRRKILGEFSHTDMDRRGVY
jgi:hypothetical protein